MIHTFFMSIEGVDTEQFAWQKAGACNLAPSYVFFPEEQNDPYFQVQESTRGKTYKDFCNACPVKAICLEFALLHDLSGIWGGTTESERKNRFGLNYRNELREEAAYYGTYRALYGHS